MLTVCLAALESDVDRELFTQIYQQYADQMMRVAGRILTSAPRAEDAVHDAFLKIIQHFDDLKSIPEERRIFWIITITKNAALDILRKESREAGMDEAAESKLPSSPAEEGGFRTLVEIIRRLPETYRRVLELRFLAEWSHAEIAQELHISEGAVKTRVSRGRQILITEMAKEGFACE